MSPYPALGPQRSRFILNILVLALDVVFVVDLSHPGLPPNVLRSVYLNLEH